MSTYRTDIFEYPPIGYVKKITDLENRVLSLEEISLKQSTDIAELKATIVWQAAEMMRMQAEINNLKSERICIEREPGLLTRLWRKYIR